ncbi:MAG: glycosyl transferase [Renibacterium sp.]|nr:glycosyl transferase [Renibacterium sp.]
MTEIASPTAPHILMASMPAAGHVYPHLEVIRALVAAGYRVTYLIGAGFKEVVEATGADFLGYDSAFPRLGGATKAADDSAGAAPELAADLQKLNPALGMVFMANDTAAMLPVLKELFESDRPDLVLFGSGAPAAGIFAEKMGAPAVAMVPAFASWDGAEAEMLKRMGGVDMSDPRLLEAKERLQQSLDGYGLGEFSHRIGFNSNPDQALVFIPEALQPHPEKVDRSVYHFAGAAISDSQSDADWDLPSGQKIMLISLGSTFTRNVPFYRACMEAFGGLAGWHVVLQIGPLTTVEELGEIPANVEVHHWLPQVAILKRADVFLTHAGMGGSREGLALGVPMIAAPQAVDQFQNADSLVAAGVAVKVDGFEVTASELRAALAAVQQPAIRERSREIAREMAEQDGVRFSLEFIASLLADKVAV